MLSTALASFVIGFAMWFFLWRLQQSGWAGAVAAMRLFSGVWAFSVVVRAAARAANEGLGWWMFPDAIVLLVAADVFVNGRFGGPK